MNRLAFRRRLPPGQMAMDRGRTGQAARYAPELESLQALERVLAAARLGEAALLRAARHCGVEDLLSGRARATGTLSFAGNDQER